MTGRDKVIDRVIQPVQKCVADRWTGSLVVRFEQGGLRGFHREQIVREELKADQLVVRPDVRKR